jgi:hypothetical protein
MGSDGVLGHRQDDTVLNVLGPQVLGSQLILDRLNRLSAAFDHDRGALHGREQNTIVLRQPYPSLAPVLGGLR